MKGIASVHRGHDYEISFKEASRDDIYQVHLFYDTERHLARIAHAKQGRGFEVMMELEMADLYIDYDNDEDSDLIRILGNHIGKDEDSMEEWTILFRPTGNCSDEK